MAPESYDAVIVGSGATGGWVAKELTEAGLRVVVLEAGRKLDPAVDYSEHARPYDMPLRGRRLARRELVAQQQVQVKCYQCDEYTNHLFVKDTECPYTTPKDKPFSWIRGRHVGGKSITWGRQSYRLSDYDLKAASRDGFGQDWPLDYAELKPYYDRVDRFIGISGAREGLPQLPDGEFLPPMDLTCGELHAREVLKAKFGRTLTIGRTAILTAPLNGRPACHYCGPCSRGCSTGSYYSSPHSSLPAAFATGRLTLIPNAVVSHVETGDEGRCRSVAYIDRLTHAHREVAGKLVVLCASTLETNRIMLNSRSPRHPQGLGNSSGLLGHYLMDHVMGGRGQRHPAHAQGRGRRARAAAERHLRAPLPQHRREAPGLPARLWLPGRGQPGEVGSRERRARLRRLLQAEGARHAGLDLQLLGLRRVPAPVRESRAPGRHRGGRLGHSRAPHRLRLRRQRERQVRDMAATAEEMLKAMGAEDVKPRAEISAPGLGIHEVGGARMGNDPKTSVVNRWQQAHDVKNLFLMDGSVYPSSGCQNPTITFMALGSRACAHLVEDLKRGDL